MIEKVNANAVTMRLVLGKDGMAGESSERRKGVDSSTTASSSSSAGGCGVVGAVSRSGVDAGMLEARLQDSGGRSGRTLRHVGKFTPTRRFFCCLQLKLKQISLTIEKSSDPDCKFL